MNKRTLECPDAPAWWYPLGVTFVILVVAGICAMPAYFLGKLFLLL